MAQSRPESWKGSVLASAANNPNLIFPYMAKIGPDGNLYVTAGAICPSDGSAPAGFPPNFAGCNPGNKPGGKVVKISLARGEDSQEEDQGPGRRRTPAAAEGSQSRSGVTESSETGSFARVREAVSLLRGGNPPVRTARRAAETRAFRKPPASAAG